MADNEHYFLSASRDKTVKLWLLKNHGNGTAHLGCSGTYSQHSRAVFCVQGIESKRWVASSDGVVNVRLFCIIDNKVLYELVVLGYSLLKSYQSLRFDNSFVLAVRTFLFILDLGSSHNTNNQSI